MNFLTLNFKIKCAESIPEIISFAGEIRNNKNLKKHEKTLLCRIKQFWFNKKEAISLANACQVQSTQSAVLKYFSEEQHMSLVAFALESIKVIKNLKLADPVPNVIGECLCPVHQIEKLCEESSDNKYLWDEWAKIVKALKEKGMIVQIKPEKMLLFGITIKINEVVDQCQVSEEMQFIMATAIEEINKKSAYSSDKIAMVLPSMEINNDTETDIPVEEKKQIPSIWMDDDPANQLRATLEKQKEDGTLDTFKIIMPSGDYTIEELLDTTAFIDQPEILEVLREFAEKI